MKMKKTSVVFMFDGQPIKTKEVITDLENIKKTDKIFVDGTEYTVFDVQKHINDCIHYTIKLM